jgi:phosphatidylinositol-bisphosphatase
MKLTFVNTHLAAFDDMAERRNADFHDLGRRLIFNAASADESNKDASLPSLFSIYESHVLFWMVRGLA